MKRYFWMLRTMAAVLAAVFLLEFVPVSAFEKMAEAFVSRPQTDAAEVFTDPADSLNGSPESAFSGSGSASRDISTVKITGNPDSEAAGEAQTETAPVRIVGEAESKREESVKHFRLSDGTYIAAVYPYPVHYKDGNTWKDIDNSLVLSGAEAENGTAALREAENGALVRAEARAPQFAVSFAQQLSDTQLVRLGSGARTVSLTPRNVASLPEQSVLQIANGYFGMEEMQRAFAFSEEKAEATETAGTTGATETAGTARATETTTIWEASWDSGITGATMYT